MFAGCRWHHWPHNHCWSHRGRGLIFKAFSSNDSLCIHEIDHSGLSLATCASSPQHPPQIWVVVACRACVLAAAPAESGRDGVMAIEHHQKVARWPLVIKAVRGTKSNGGREKELQMSSKFSFYCVYSQTLNIWRLKRTQCWRWNDKSWAGIKQNKAMRGGESTSTVIAGRVEFK